MGIGRLDMHAVDLARDARHVAPGDRASDLRRGIAEMGVLGDRLQHLLDRRRRHDRHPQRVRIVEIVRRFERRDDAAPLCDVVPGIVVSQTPLDIADGRGRPSIGAAGPEHPGILLQIVLHAHAAQQIDMAVSIRREEERHDARAQRLRVGERLGRSGIQDLADLQSRPSAGGLLLEDRIGAVRHRQALDGGLRRLDEIAVQRRALVAPDPAELRVIQHHMQVLLQLCASRLGVRAGIEVRRPVVAHPVLDEGGVERGRAPAHEQIGLQCIVRPEAVGLADAQPLLHPEQDPRREDALGRVDISALRLLADAGLVKTEPRPEGVSPAVALGIAARQGAQFAQYAYGRVEIEIGLAHLRQADAGLLKMLPGLIGPRMQVARPGPVREEAHRPQRDREQANGRDRGATGDQRQPLLPADRGRAATSPASGMMTSLSRRFRK